MASDMASSQSKLMPKSLKFGPSGSCAERMCLLSLAGSKATWLALPQACRSFWQWSIALKIVAFSVVPVNSRYALRSSA